MILPIIGIRLKSKKFVPLITVSGKVRPVLEVYKSDFLNDSIPIYVCSMENEKQVKKIYKIGKISIAENYFTNLKEDAEDDSKDKNSLFIETKFDDGKNISIVVLAGNEKNKIALKEYTANINEEFEQCVAEEREELLLDYGNFVKCKQKSGYLLPEKDLTEDGLVMSESGEENSTDKSADVQKKNKKQKESTKDDFDEAVKTRIKTRGSLSAKINAMFVFFVLITVAAITAGIGYFVYQDTLSKIESTCAEKTRTASVLVEKKIKSLSSNALVLNSIYGKSKTKKEDMDNFFKSNPDVALISLTDGYMLINDDFVIKQGINQNNLVNSLLELVFAKNQERLNSGKSMLFNLSHYVKTRTAGLCIPVLDEKTNTYKIVSVIFSTTDFETVCENGDEYSTYFAEESGNLIAGISYDWVMQCHNLCEFKNKINKVTSLSDYGCYVATYVKLDGYDKYLIDTLVKMAYIAGAVLIIMVLIMTAFGKSIVRPINKMRLAIDKVDNGDFNFNIKSRRHDELGALVKSFSKMCVKFSGRDSYRKTFGNATTDSIYENDKNGNINLNGETKITTVLISEIKDFDTLTKGMTASEVIKLLNEYVSEMEPCITATGGYINKIVGNKIFAVWGVPLSSGTPKSDAVNAIKSAFRMKYALVDYNSDRGTANNPLVKVGFGLHTGATVSGLVGINEIREYACVGTTVDSAYEIENYTKSFGCDILISEDTYLLVNDIIEAQKISGVSIKGQKEAITLYAVSALKK